MIPIFDSVFLALGKGFEVWDSYNKTRYARRFRDIYKEIAEEMAKPIYGDLHYKYLRDQAKIDRLQLEMKILIDEFLKESPNDHE